MINLNGTMVHYSASGDTVFLPLPRELWRPILEGRPAREACQCAECAKRIEADPSYVPSWDTLAMATKPEPGRATRTAWTVHKPDSHPR